MLEWLKIIGKIILMLLGFKQKKDKRKEKIKKEASNDIEKGIKEKDPSHITAGFDKLSRM